MRWLQLSTIDLANGFGGVEFHARRLCLELNRLGVETDLSQDFSELSNPKWDVVQTHGSAIEPLHVLKRRSGSGPTYIQTLHGTSWERIRACGEWAWPGGYTAGARELLGVMKSDLVLSGHPDTSFYLWAKRFGKPVAVCHNGWDNPEKEKETQSSDLPRSVADRLKGETAKARWVFIGRGEDFVKGADQLIEAVRGFPKIEIFAVPGDGFESAPEIIPTGKLSAGQLDRLLESCRGLILPSRYEGYSIALVEALGRGLEVVATEVGAVSLLKGKAQGLICASENSSRGLKSALEVAQSQPVASRGERAQQNQKILHRWSDVARIALDAVKAVRSPNVS